MDGPHPTPSSGWCLSLVLPAYNEASCIVQAIEEADAALARLTNTYEILVVDDGSTDATAALVAGLANCLPNVRLLRHEHNQGYGAALRTGFEAARYERVAFTDADCQFHLEDLGKLLELTERVPIAVGYRVARQDPWRRRFLSRGYNLLARTLLGTGVRDCDCALKVFRREALARVLPESTGFFVNTEMLTKARQQGLEVAEVGVRHRPRPRGASKVSLLDVPRTLGRLLPFWWSRVLFPGGKGEQSAAERGVWSWLPLGVLLVLAALLFLTRLQAPLLEPQEPRYAEIPRQMLAEGRWVVPVLHGQPYLDKPPLLYWATMASYQIFGVTDRAARVVPGLAGLLTVLVTYLWGRARVGARAAFWGGLVLCLSARFVYLERMLTFDGLLCLWVTAGLAAAHAALGGCREWSGNVARDSVAEPPRSGGLHYRWGWWLTAAVACGLGLLTKGPVALVLVVVPVLIYRLLDSRCPRLGFRAFAALFGGAFLVAVPWYLAVMLRQPEFAGHFFWQHNIVRFLAPFDHAEPFWFHLPGLLLGMLPWALLLPGFVVFVLRRSARTAARRPPALGFFLLAWVWAVLFFSLSGCKRAVYILPALPPLALALGYYLSLLVSGGRVAATRTAAQLLRSAAKRGRTNRLAGQATGLVLVLSLGIVGIAGWNGLWPLALVSTAGALLLGLLVGLWVGRVRSWSVCAATTFAVLFAGLQLLLPAYNRQFALRDELRAHARTLAGARGPVFCYPQRWDSVSFYLPHVEVKIFSRTQRQQLLDELQKHPEALLLVKSGEPLRDVLRELPDSVEYVSRRPQGAITVGLVRWRGVPEVELYAGR